MAKQQHIVIPPELEEEMTPAVKAFVLVLCERIAKLEVKVEKLTKKDPKLQTSLKWVNLDKKNPKSNSQTIARRLPDIIRRLLVIKEANLELGI